MPATLMMKLHDGALNPTRELPISKSLTRGVIVNQGGPPLPIIIIIINLIIQFKYLYFLHFLFLF